MANRLGIDIKVNFPEANKLKADFDKKWKAMSESYKAEIKVKADEGSMSKMRSQINKYFESNKLELKIKLNTTQAMSDLKTFHNKFSSLKNEMQKGIDVKLNAGSADSKNLFANAAKNGEQVSNVVKKTNEEVNTMVGRLNKVDSVYDKIVQSSKASGDGLAKSQTAITKTLNSFQKETETYVNGQRKSVKSTMDRSNALKEISSVMKEINGLEVKSAGAERGTKQAIDGRVASLKSYLTTMKSDYKEVFGSNSSDEFMIKNIKSIGEYNMQLKKASLEKAKQKEADQETAGVVKKLMSLENERFNLLKRSDSVGKEEASALRKQASVIEEKSAALRKQHDILSKINAGQAQSLNTLTRENEAAREFSSTMEKAKNSDKARVASQVASYNNLKNEMKEIYAIQDRIVALTAKQKAGVMNGKEEAELQALRGQLEIKTRLNNASKAQALSQDKITEAQRKSLEASRQEYVAKNKVKQSIADVNAKIQKGKSLYDEMGQSVRKVESLNKQLANSGKFQATQIMKVIDAENRKQAQIRESIGAQGLMNKSLDTELAKRKRVNAEITAQNAKIAKGRKIDDSSNSGMMGQMFNPMTVASNARQAFTTIYDSVAKVDKQMVAIAKVADVPEDVLGRFSANLYDNASAVGKSADAYAESVGRWVTTGKTLSESIELANASVMGSFVGNIVEDDMVRYMAVPLNAFKEEMLGAKDIVNAMNEVSNNNAIEMNDLGAAYERAGATAANAGTSFAELTGMVTGAQEATRAGGEKIGTAMKAVDVNFGKISSRLQKGDVSKFDWFKNIGVEIQNSEGDLRSTFDILSQLQGVWKGLSNNDRATASFYAAGKNHSSIFTGMLENWESVKKATAEAQDQVDLYDKDSGSAFEEFAKQQDSVEFKAANLSNTWAEFLAVVSGGKDGVMTILAGLSDIVKVMTGLAENKFIRDIGLIAIKATLFLTLSTAMGKFFTIISAGSLATLRSMSALLPLMSKAGRLSAANARVDAVAGTTRGAMGAISAFGKFLPVIGMVFLALDAINTVYPIWDKLGGAIKKVTNNTTESEKSLDSYKKKQKELNKEIAGNSLLNGELERTDKIVQSWEQLKKAKQEAHNENGEISATALTEEEFANMKRTFDGQAEALGLDIRLEMNDYDHIEGQFKKLIEFKDALTKEDSIKLIDKMNEKYKFQSTNGINKDYQKKKDENDYGIQMQENWIKSNSLTISDEELKSRQEEIAKLSKYSAFEGDKYGSSEMIKVEKENNKRIADIAKQRQAIVKSAASGNLIQGFDDISPEKQREAIGLLASELPLLNKKIQTYQNVKEAVASNTKLEEKQMKVIREKFGNLSTETDQWDRLYGPEKKAEVEKYLQEIVDVTVKQKETLATNLEQFASKAGMSPEEVNALKEAAQQGGAAFMKAMSAYGEQGASMLGVTAKIQAKAKDLGTDWQTIALGMQEQVDKLNAVNPDKVIKFNLLQDNGIVNMDAIDDIYSLPDEVIKKFKLLNEDTGEVNLERMVPLLERANSLPNEVQMKLGIEQTGVDMETIAKIYGLDNETIKRFKLVNEQTGDIEWENLTKMIQEIPPETVKKLKLDVNKDGKIELEEFLGRYEQLSPNELKELNVEVKVDKKGAEEADAVADNIQKMDGKKSKVEVTVATEQAENSTKLLNEKLEILSGSKPLIEIAADKAKADKAIQESREKISTLDGLAATPKINADDTDNKNKTAGAKTATEALNAVTGTLNINADKKDFDTKYNDVSEKSAQGKTLTVAIKGVKDTVVSWWESLTGGSSKTVNMNIKGKKSSVAVANPQLGRSFSASVGSQVGGVIGKSKSTSTGNPRYSEENIANQKIDEDTWRYWAKELFKGLPLEKSMDDLNNSITKSKDNQDKLISLYKQQNALLDKQIAYQNEMKGAKQSELNSIMAELRKHGFQTSGNQVTNLGHAQSFRGEKATEVGELLTNYKELYTAIDSLNGTISSLNMDKFNLTESIKEAEIAKELKQIEDSLKKTTAILKAVENNTSLLDKKQSLVGEADVELKLTLSEEGLNSSSRNVALLTDEFNRLSTTTVKHAENAKEVESQLEQLKSEILSNADAVIEYRDKINTIKIDRLISDYERFNEVISSNIEKLTNNIDNLKSGLLDGSTFGDLVSSSFGDLDFDRKSKLEREQEERLKLEAELNEALDGYAKKNVDRTTQVANDILTVEKNKYAALLKMASEFSNGKGGDVKVNNPNSAIGLTEVENTSSSKEYSDWLNKLKAVNAQYSKAMLEMQTEYDAAMKGAKDKGEKELLTNKLIIDQLKLQEKIYRDMMTVNNSAIDQAKKELENTSLTTEQREKLIEAIKEYENANSDAQNSIKDTISSRYEYEFDLMDKATTKAQKYSETLSQLLNIANLVNTGTGSKQSIFDAIYEGKLNEYSKAKEQLKQLQDEQNKFAEGSYEWNILNDKIQEVTDSFNELTVGLLEANKNALGNRLDTIKEDSEKGMLDGKTLDEWKDHREKWVSGIEKEIELEKLRKRMLDLESNVNKEKLEMLDRQDKVSKKDLEYLDKQTKVLELQEKLNNISKERKVQTITKKDDGSWGWDYVADQTEYDKTKEELDTAKKDLEDFKKQQRESYVTDLSSVLDKAKNGDYKSSEELKAALDNLKAVYGNVLGDIPEVDMGNMEEIVKAYQDYLAKNQDIVSNITGGKDNTGLQNAMDSAAKQFEQSFKNVSAELGKIIGEEIRSALNLANKSAIVDGRGYVIQNQVLEFPNVKDVDGFEEVLRTLPQVAAQITTSK